jgi:uncharacterized protein YjeT (DUF2065 family)
MDTTNHRAVPIAVCVLVIVTAVFLLVNGAFMLVVPKAWYEFVPGVTETGFYNQHFVRDIGLIQMFLGAAFLIGLVRPAARLALWAAATAWLIAHAGFHVWEVAVGICAPSALLRDFPAVSLPALIGIAATAWAWRSRPPTTARAGLTAYPS